MPKKRPPMLLIIIAVSLCIGIGVRAEKRICGPQTVSLNGEWDFAFTAPVADAIPPLPADDEFEVQVTVPGRWDDQLNRFTKAKWFTAAGYQRITSSGFAAGSRFGEIKYLYGNGWHRRTFDAPAWWKGRKVMLTVGWAIGRMNVWLNRQHVGSYDYGAYTPYETDIGEYLRLGGKNELLISVDNTKGFGGGYAFAEPHGKVGGIPRPVILRISAGEGRISDLYIRPGETLKDVYWQIDLEGVKKISNVPGSQLAWKIRDSENGNILTEGRVDVPSFRGSHRIRFQSRAERIEPWSDRHPNLYWADIQWMGKKGRSLDTIRQRFGLRRWSYEGRKLFLNGKPMYLRGEFIGGYYPVHCAVPTTREYWRMRFQRAKEIGMNYLNFANQVCPIEMMEAADETGMILQCGDSATSADNKADQDRYREVWTPIVRLTRRYPSMSIYGFNGERDYYEGIIEQFQKHYDLIKALHPESLVMPQQAIRGIDYSFDEKGKQELTLAPFPHHAERLARYTKACDFFGHYSCGALSYSYDKPPLWHEMDKRFAIYSRPISAHELFMGASYLNPDNAAKYTGRIPPTLYSILEEDLTRSGLIDRWKTYHYNASRLQGICKKYNVEKVRKCRELTAYEFLSMRDSHFIPHYTVGILDEFFGLKPGDTVEGIRNYIGESVLLLDYDGGESINRAYGMNTSFKADLMVSPFGENPLRKGTLTWTLADGNRTLSGDKSEIANVPNGCVTTLKTLAITWPRVEKTTRMKLNVTLSGDGYDIANDWDFWIFPKLTPPRVTASADPTNFDRLKGRYPSIKRLNSRTQEKLMIVSDLGKKEIRHLKTGGDVLLLDTKSFPLHTGFTNFRSGLGGRAHHNVGKVINPHPVFADLPDEGWGDWHFYSIFDGAENFLWNRWEKDFSVPFDPIIEVISSGADVRKQALMFELRVGAGRLFASNCVYREDNVACVALMDGILRYMQSDKFNPRGSVSPETITKLLSREEKKPVSPPAAGPGSTVPDFTSTQIQDTIAPIIRIETTLPIDQEGGLYYAQPATRFILRSRDDQSGIRSFEVSVDSGPYHIQTEPFILTPGRHELRARARDNGGNVSTTITGEALTGGDTECVTVLIK